MILRNSNLTPSLHEVMHTAIDRAMMGMYFCLPATIVTYETDKQYADVQISLLQQSSTGDTLPYPVISNVPVKHPRAAGGTAFIHMPLVAGDQVLLVFSQSSLDNWKVQAGGMVDPDDPRKLDASDAFALIGGASIPAAFSPQTADAIEIVNGEAAIQVFPTGKFKITNGVNELVDLVQQIAQQLGIATTNTIFGPMPLNNFATFEEIAVKLLTLVE